MSDENEVKVSVWRLWTTSDGCGYGHGGSTSMVLPTRDAAIQKMQSLPGVCMGVREPLKDGLKPTCNGYRAEPEDWDLETTVKRKKELEDQLTQINLILERFNELDC